MIEEWIEGEWYFAVHCHSCGWQFAFAHTDNQLPECHINLICIECGQSDYYCPKEFVDVQAR